MRFEDTPLFQKSFDLYKTLHTLIQKFPRTEKFTLGERLKSHGLTILETVIRAGIQSGTERLRQLEEASTQTDLLKVLVRLSFELRLLDQKHYLLLAGLLQEIGKMVGGWIKNVKAPT